ncbi:MAG TPA: tripartite tricarboxylate transporter substrate binding protein [Pseudorhodoferax sp.]|nr:tripartite tricarboxylate transporter substrate binding protein [Pseudorhodoferax sp.]
MLKKLLVGVAAATALLTSLAAEKAADFPSKPIRIVVPFGAGGAGDQLARAMAVSVAEQTGQPLVVENRVGANGAIGSAAVAQAAPDGYTLLLATTSTHAGNAFLMKQIPYDPVKDFTPVTAVSRGDLVLLVHPSLPAKTAPELVALAKKEPGAVSFASGNASTRIASEMFANATGTQLLHVPYKSNSLAVVDLLSGQVKMMIADTAVGAPYVRSGQLRALGVTGRQRSPDLPAVPTLREAGIANYEALPWWNAIYAPAGTPPEIVDKLNRILVAAARSPAAAGFYKSSGAEVFTTSPQELGRYQQAEAAKWKAAIDAAGMQPE